MISITSAFSGFSVRDIDRAEQFYSKKLGLKTSKSPMGLMIELPGGGRLFIYAKDNHQPATYTVLNLEVEDIETAVEGLKSQGVELEHYDHMNQDADGISRGRAANMGPDIAWFKDPAGNILAVVQN